MNKGKVELESFRKEGGFSCFEYLISHNDGTTTLEQTLRIACQTAHLHSVSGEAGFSAEITLNDFPPQKTPAEAALKLAAWLERLAASIRSGDYLPLQSTSYRELPANEDANK